MVSRGSASYGKKVLKIGLLRRLLDLLVRRGWGEKPLLRVHHPPFQEDKYRMGALVPHEGKTYVVTRWVERDPVHLARGGSVPEWEIWGREVSDAVTDAAVHEEAERILREAGGPGDDGLDGPRDS